MLNSLSLVEEVNIYLDEIDKNRIIDEKNIEKLEQYRTNMLIYGFNAPLKSLISMAKEDKSKGTDELQDQKKQNSQLKYIAQLKKFTLNRLRVAIASHKIIGVLKDTKKEGLIRHLPLGGSYRKILIDEGETATEAYHNLISLFEQKKHPFRSASAIISIMQDGVEVERTVQLDADSNAKERIKKMFGEDAKIKEIELKKKTSGLIKNYSTKIALFSMATIYASKQVREKMKEEEEGKVREYNDILRRYKLVADVDITTTDRFENVKNELVKKNLIRKMKYEYAIEPEFEGELFSRRSRKYRDTINLANEQIYLILQWYYVCMHAEQRKKYVHMPSVIAQPEEGHLLVLDEIAPIGYKIQKPAKDIWQKIEFEKKSIPLSSDAWGPAFLCIKQNLDADWIADELRSCDAKKIKNAIDVLKPLVDKPDSRGTMFLDAIKKERENVDS